MKRDVLGLEAADPARKLVTLRFPELKLDWCEGSLPTPDGRVELRWRRTGGELHYRLRLPAGYTVEVKNLSRQKLVRE